MKAKLLSSLLVVTAGCTHAPEMRLGEGVTKVEAERTIGRPPDSEKEGFCRVGAGLEVECLVQKYEGGVRGGQYAEVLRLYFKRDEQGRWTVFKQKISTF